MQLVVKTTRIVCLNAKNQQALKVFERFCIRNNNQNDKILKIKHFFEKELIEKNYDK